MGPTHKTSFYLNHAFKDPILEYTYSEGFGKTTSACELWRPVCLMFPRWLQSPAAVGALASTWPSLGSSMAWRVRAQLHQGPSFPVQILVLFLTSHAPWASGSTSLCSQSLGDQITENTLLKVVLGPVPGPVRSTSVLLFHVWFLLGGYGWAKV